MEGQRVMGVGWEGGGTLQAVAEQLTFPILHRSCEGPARRSFAGLRGRELWKGKQRGVVHFCPQQSLQERSARSAPNPARPAAPPAGKRAAWKARGLVPNWSQWGKAEGFAAVPPRPELICPVVGAGRQMEPAPRLLAWWEVVPGGTA